MVDIVLVIEKHNKIDAVSNVACQGARRISKCKLCLSVIAKNKCATIASAYSWLTLPNFALLGLTLMALEWWSDFVSSLPARDRISLCVVLAVKETKPSLSIDAKCWNYHPSGRIPRQLQIKFFKFST